jgi:hypothetical protein
LMRKPPRERALRSDSWVVVSHATPPPTYLSFLPHPRGVLPFPLLRTPRKRGCARPATWHRGVGDFACVSFPRVTPLTPLSGWAEGTGRSGCGAALRCPVAGTHAPGPPQPRPLPLLLVGRIAGPAPRGAARALRRREAAAVASWAKVPGGGYSPCGSGC